jgi:N-acyl-D-aspartate/D-glutamate deacylase
MAELAREALAAGAIGFATDTMPLHRSSDGKMVPTYGASDEELETIAAALADFDGSYIQVLPDFLSPKATVEVGIGLMKKLAMASGKTVTYSLGQLDAHPDRWREVLDQAAQANQLTGVAIKAQVLPRATGMYLGFNLSFNPFLYSPSYAAIADLPLKKKIVQLRRPEVRERILKEASGPSLQPLHDIARRYDRMFAIGEDWNYEPSLDQCIAAIASRERTPPEEIVYDFMLRDDGHAMLYTAITNYASGSLGPALEMMRHPDAILGLGDGGAHYGLVCDGAYPTFMLSYWTRDRQGERIPLAEAVRMLTSGPAQLAGFRDRGVLKPGFKADINIIDYERLRWHAPTVQFDLPGGGRRIDQKASGYVATIVSGEIIVRDDLPTGRLPGKLVRGPQPAPFSSAA